MLDLAVGEAWTWCSADFAGWDFRHGDGTRLEVKQAAAKQTWDAPPRPAAPRFDIRARTGHWIGARWIEGAGRNADIYVFAYQPRIDEAADHRDPEQWVFYVVPSANLPESKSISLTSVQRLADGCSYEEVASCIERARMQRQPQLGSRPSPG